MNRCIVSIVLIAISFLGLTITGCVYYMPAAVSSASLGAKEHPVRVVTGHSGAYYFLGMGPTGNDSLEAAVEDAKSQAKSDSMINVFIDRSVYCFPFDFFCIFKKIDTSVYGTLIRYDDPWTQGNVLPTLPRSDTLVKPTRMACPADIALNEHARIVLNDGKNIEGILLSCDSDGIVIRSRLLNQTFTADQIKSIQRL